MQEAEGAFGDPTVFIERAVVDPRHRGADPADGEGRKLGDPPLQRDCSVQRRHQKVVEIAPAPNLDPGCGTGCARTRCGSPARSATATPARSSSCWIRQGNYVFIEMNLRIQVEHTVTEEVTDVDLVQIRRCGSPHRARPGRPGRPRTRSPCAARHAVPGSPPRTRPRPTPACITTYRLPGRRRPLDAAPPTPARAVSAHFDSMLAKDLSGACRTFGKPVKARRALREFRIRGCPNIPFLQAVSPTPDFIAGGHVTTSFIETHPQLLQARGSGDRGSAAGLPRT